MPGEDPRPAPAELTPEEIARLRAAKAAERAERAERRARKLADEYARLTAPPQSVAADEPTEASTEPERAPLLLAGGALVACLAFAVIALVLYLTSSSGSQAASVRDDVLISARQDIVVLNTLDYRHVDAGLRRWAAASTGTLHDQLTDVTAAEKKHIVSARSVTTAKVLDAAVVSLDDPDGSASVIASVEVTVAKVGQQAQVKRERLHADLTRVSSIWKVNSLEQVGVTVS